MQIVSLVFDPAPRTPTLHTVGITLAVTPDVRQKTRLAFEVTCRVASARVPRRKLAVPSAIFLTAVHAPTQRPVLVNVVGERVLFDEDASEGGGYVVVVARGELDTAGGPSRPFFLHASCFEFVSNVIHVA